MDFFTRPCPPALTPLKNYVTAYSDKVYLNSLPLHVHQVLGAFVVYQAVFLFISPWLSRLVVPRFYNNFNKRTQINWDVHVVSFVQSTFICTIALWGIYTDTERLSLGQDKSHAGALYRIFGYTVTGGAVQGYATGYFLWDLMVSVYYVEIMGLGFVAHAISALVVFSLGFRPFVNYYAPIFILFEFSSPFLNIHWFCDKLNLTGSIYQLINGLCLITTFFFCRLIWGTYNSVLVFKDIFGVYAHPPPSAAELIGADALADKEALVHPYAGKTVPLWLAVVYLGSNLTLNGLNYFWFSRMIQTVAARFTAPQQKEKVEEDEKVLVEGTEVDLATAADIAGRKAKEARIRLSAAKH